MKRINREEKVCELCGKKGYHIRCSKCGGKLVKKDD